MIARIIALSVRHRVLVLLLTAILLGLGLWSLQTIRLDAIPDLSDVQVIVVTEYPGQNPQVVDDQVTYPMASAMLAVPGSTYVRGYSMFELSFVYVLFEDGTDPYWARSRVLEYLSFARDRLPAGVQPRLGPDATGVGWVYQYVLYPGWYCADHPHGIWHDVEQDRWYPTPETAPEDRRAMLTRVRGFETAGTCPLDSSPLVSSNQDLAQLRSLQDWYLRYPLTAVGGVSEVASIGGFVRQYQVVLQPERLQAYRLSLADVTGAIERSNTDVGGSVVEMSEHEYMVRSRGYLRGLDDLRDVVVGTGERGTPIMLGDVATLEIGGEMRRGIGELDGRGEAVGGVVVARYGENALQVIRDAKAKLTELEDGLPPGVFIKSTYDRSGLIERAVDTLREAVIEQLLLTAFICLAFLGHVRSAIVAVVVLPIGLLVSLLVMQVMGINANIMSLGGLSLAIGVMVDSGVVMIENAHKHLERERERIDRGEPPRGQIAVVLEAAQEVGPSLFFSLLVITVAFLPIFVLGDQSGRLFKPLAYTKTFAIAAGAVLGITVVPVLMVYLVRGRIPAEERNPLNRFSMRLYDPAFRLVMRHPAATLVITLVLGLSALWPMSQLGEEFMPALEEGDLLYMPTTDPSISVTKSKELLQQTDRLIKTFPEVASVHGKIGRADSATDPAPLSMIETVVQLQTDPARWRTRTVGSWWPRERRITMDELKYGWTDADGTVHPGLNQAVAFPGVANAWPYPIENRINMLATGIKTPVGIKIMGPDLETLSEVAERTATAIRAVPGTLSAYPERTFGGYYLDVDVDRAAAARYGLTTGDVQDTVQAAIGGMNVTTTVEGLERYPLNVRYARELRDDVPSLRQILVATKTGGPVPLGQLAKITITPGPPMIRSENAQRTAWIYVDIAGRDLGGYVREAKRVVAAEAPLPAGYTRVWSGRFEYLEAANARLRVVIPITLALIVLLLYVATQSWLRVGIILLAVPFSMIGAFWFLWLLGYDMSLAVWVGIIALLGVDAETGQVMLLYLDTTYDRYVEEGRMRTPEDLFAAIHEGAVQRIRPKTMTVATDMIGLLPMLWATGTGADVTRRLVAPLIGGIGVSFLLELLVYPVLFLLAKRWQMRQQPS
ncbi:MAG TPA: CusA/CzcA family heavy metal efflux RND transporter [Candidatus Binatia bacterium]|jgi:Cu(I)/Ag(I) efflux system membrane protein CusA/SilA|nr:CusA/CzcA family heavy metal efflux RND transporter [Candidatus Binatia bacterium]